MCVYVYMFVRVLKTLREKTVVIFFFFSIKLLYYLLYSEIPEGVNPAKKDKLY